MNLGNLSHTVYRLSLSGLCK